MIYAIGDIHGELAKLHWLLKKIEADGATADDRLVFVGDYVDRGPDTAGVIELLIQLKSYKPSAVFLRGNHDQAMVDARDIFDAKRSTDLTVADVAWWFQYGGRETIDSYPRGERWYDCVPDHHWEFLESTQLEYRDGSYIFVHAGLSPPGMGWSEYEDPRLWIREPFIRSMADFGGVVVFGHTPQAAGRPLVMANKIGIDTGAAYGGPLTAVALDPEKPYKPGQLRFIQAV